jgi:hypothetical protein
MDLHLRHACLAALAALAISTPAAFADPAAIPANAAAPASDEAAATFAALQAQVKEHLKDKAVDALKSDVKEIAKAYPAADPRMKKDYGNFFVSMTRLDSDDLKKVVIVAVGDLKDPDLFNVVRPFLAQPDKRAVPTHLQPAIEATGKMAPDTGVELLMKIVTDSKEYNIAAAAMKAFGGYKDNKRVRVSILRDAINTVSKDKPSVGYRWKKTGNDDPYITAKLRSSAESQSRWAALGPALVEGLNKLTGQNCGSPEDWFGMYDSYKTSPSTLFLDT